MKIRNTSHMNIESKWKNENKEYMNELQKFLDLAENIENQDLKHDIIIQMLKCDETLTKLAEKEFYKYKQEKND